MAESYVCKGGGNRKREREREPVGHGVRARARPVIVTLATVVCYAGNSPPPPTIILHIKIIGLKVCYF